MSSFGQGWKVRRSASMIAPPSSAFLATSTFGPTGTAWAAACCDPAPANMFLAMTAVITAMTSAPTSSASFFTSMARSPPPNGPLEQPQKSDKLVKKALGENREPAKGDRDPIRNFGTSLAAHGPVPGENAQRERAAGERHQHKKFDRSGWREPQRKRRGELDVAAAHHPGVERSSQQHENDSACGQRDCHAAPR